MQALHVREIPGPAMFHAKAAGGWSYALVDAAMHEAAVKRLRLETELRRAVERREFRMWYQPIISLRERRIVGVEALVRWQHPERGLLLPGRLSRRRRGDWRRGPH
jgi:sensor c-di-GMP phosphodiesterase-like protein